MNIDIQNDAQYPIDEARLRTAVQTVLAQQQADPDSAVSVVINDDAQVQALRILHVFVGTDVAVLAADDEHAFLANTLQRFHGLRRAGVFIQVVLQGIRLGKGEADRAVTCQ